MPAEYFLQHRYQDSGWAMLDDEEFTSLAAAIWRAAVLSCDSVCYGMVRVVDRSTKTVVTTFSAGTPNIISDR